MSWHLIQWDIWYSQICLFMYIIFLNNCKLYTQQNNINYKCIYFNENMIKLNWGLDFEWYIGVPHCGMYKNLFKSYDRLIPVYCFMDRKSFTWIWEIITPKKRLFVLKCFTRIIRISSFPSTAKCSFFTSRSLNTGTLIGPLLISVKSSYSFNDKRSQIWNILIQFLNCEKFQNRIKHDSLTMIYKRNQDVYIFPASSANFFQPNW